jgi:periplasmic divalent cation tolerance protein
LQAVSPKSAVILEKIKKETVMGYSMVVTTCRDKEEARTIARMLLEKKLAACIQIQETESHYRWQGKTESSGEALVFIKTRSELYGEVERAITEVHSYQVPEIIKVPVENGLLSYLNWIDEVTK